MDPIPTAAVLDYLHVQPQETGLPLLAAVLDAWNRRIPWESVSRIARHQQPASAEAYIYPPARFFAEALAHGSGGTCFESNLALRALLRELGFAPTLAFCDMENSSTADPHCALVVPLDGARYIADVGYPVPTPLPLDPQALTSVEAPAYHFEATPLGDDRWAVHRYSGTFSSLSFIIRAQAVDDAAFMARLLRDHQPTGLFLDEVIIVKTMDDHILRYSEGIGLVKRSTGQQTLLPLTEAEQANLPATLSALFDLDAALIRAALGRERPYTR